MSAPGESGLAERVDALATWINELDAQVRATAVVGDAKSLKELAKALEAWSKHDPKLEERVTNRVDVLADRFATLSGTVTATATALAGKDGEIANLRRELEEGNARIEALVRDLRQSGTGTDVADLRKAVAALASERKSGGSDSRVDAIAGEVDVLAQRLDTLSKTVSTTAAGLAGKEGELASLRSRLEGGDGRAESVIAELRTSLGSLSRQVAALEEEGPRDAYSAHHLETPLLALSGKVDWLAESVEDISTNVATALAGLSANEAELAAVQDQFAEAGTRVETMIFELQQAVASLPEGGSADPAFDDRIEALGSEIDSLTAHVGRLEANATGRWDDATAATAQLAQLVADVSQRLAEVERERDVATVELRRSSEAWVAERTWVRGQLEELAAAVEETRVDELLEPKLHELASRVEAMERGHEIVGAEVARAAVAWEAEREALKTELDALATTLSSTAGSLHTPDPVSTGDEHAQEFLAQLTTRLDAMEREGSVVAAEIERAQTFWASEIGSLEARLEEVAGAVGTPAAHDPATGQRLEELALRLEAVERDRAQVGAGPPADAQELRDLRVLINGLRMRVASGEKELAALSGTGDIVARLDDLSLRLGLLERTGFAQPAPAPAPPVPGDGRFRVELRGLEQRMEQLESAARENRDAVLMQFERLASRLQWRLQQLELESSDAGYGQTKSAPATLGQVVPIRGEG